ncbi:MAG TPA: dihydroorotate dehydrogenase electron transfer subunit [Candidatus Bathyarchaeota archaeon]|nr:dihydroorotate dehydrogenase electron transfer subunit [Candidatus Bathyarchaeota archaeon]
MEHRYRLSNIEASFEIAKDIYRITFMDSKCRDSTPGQFLMIWIPNVDEIPLSISNVRGDEVTLLVRRVGEATEALTSMKPGMKIGVRGPYGNGFSLVKGRVLLIGGGLGVAPLIYLASKLRELGSEIISILGFKTSSEVIGVEELQPSQEIHIFTEDGSLGEKGTPLKILRKVIREELPKKVYTCGPETMMWRVVNLCLSLNIPVEASLERYMKCAMGICASCVLDPLGLRVCRDGPVFSGEVLKNVSDFGRWIRLPTGEKAPLQSQLLNQ